MCRSKGMFPSRIPAFCSQRLKRLPLLMVQHPLIDEGYNVFSWQGIRSEESLKRSCYPMWEQSPDSEGLTIYRPLMGWTLKDGVAIHQRHGLNLNPLYGMGFERVGCLPCINSSKNDIRITAQLFPWAIEKIRHWEEEVRAVSRLRRNYSGKFWPGADRRSRTLVKNPSRRKAVRYTVPDGTVHLRCLYLRGRAM